jgi:hypothetical protein
MGLLPVHGKNTYFKRKSGTDQHDEDQQHTEKALTIGHLKCTLTVQTRNRPHKPLRAMVITYIPADLPIIMNLEQLF